MGEQGRRMIMSWMRRSKLVFELDRLRLVDFLDVTAGSAAIIGGAIHIAPAYVAPLAAGNARADDLAVGPRPMGGRASQAR